MQVGRDKHMMSVPDSVIVVPSPEMSPSKWKWLFRGVCPLLCLHIALFVQGDECCPISLHAGGHKMKMNSTDTEPTSDIKRY